MMPPVRVAIASPLKTPAASVARQDGSTCRVITTMARHRCEERNIDWREEQATVQVSRHQAEHDRGKADPATGRKAPEWQQRGHTGKPGQESQGMANRDPVGKVERLDIGRKHLEPRPVIPK